MQSPLVNPKSLDSSEIDTSTMEAQRGELRQDPFQFQVKFQGYMDMYSQMERVIEYLNSHQYWFENCAQPMQVEPLGENGYTLMLGRLAALGYEIEPKFAVILHPSSETSYRMDSVPVPGKEPSHYEVNYQALMELKEIPLEIGKSGRAKIWQRQDWSQLPAIMTRVEWQLQLKVAVRFPKFIHKLPAAVIQTTGDRLLTQIVSRVSPHLSYKVQQDFHLRCELPIPPKSSRQCQAIADCRL